MFGSKIENVRVEKLNLDIECYMDILNGRGIRIQSTEAYHQKADKFTKKSEKVYDGLQSEFWGTDFGDQNAFEERYSCKCKKYIGKMYSGTVCEICNEPVEFHDIDLTKTGWIIMDYFSILSPIYAEKLSVALGTVDGEKVLTKILETSYDDEDHPVFTDKEMVQLKKHPYIHKGMLWLQDNIEEVLDYYEKMKTKTNHNQKKLFKELKDDQFQLFTSCIPVYSALLRTELPGEKGSKLFKLKINTVYQALIRISNFLNRLSKEDFDENRNTINMQLAAMQSEISNIFDDTYKSLMKKSGIIYSKVIGGRYNYSARNIITPSSGYLRADEVELSYSSFMELYRSELINFYHKIHNCTIMEASRVWKRGTVYYNPTLFNIMQYMVQDKECKKFMNVLIECCEPL